MSCILITTLVMLDELGKGFDVGMMEFLGWKGDFTY